VLQFRPFGRDMRPDEAPKEPVPEEEAAAADEPAADGRPGSGVALWQPPRPPGVASGSVGASHPRRAPITPADAVPPWARR
jgi:hypothetical protein